MSTSPFTPTGSIRSHTDRRRVVFATVIGTTVEWYDFFIYASAAGLVFGQLFFAPAGPQFATVLNQSKGPVPIPTQILFFLSTVFRLYWWVLLGAIANVSPRR